MPIIRKNFKVYSDVNMSLIPHPLTGDVEPLTNLDAIRQNIKNLFYLQPFDIPFQATNYSAIDRFLFELPSVVLAANMETQITIFVEAKEPRITVRSVDVAVYPDESGYNVSIKYYIKPLSINDEVSFFFQRIR